MGNARSGVVTATVVRATLGPKDVMLGITFGHNRATKEWSIMPA